MNSACSHEFMEIRKAWSRKLPDILKRCKEQGRSVGCDPYFHNWKLTPIEENVWNDIRSWGLPMYPQFPVCKRFIDFADPYLKIGIEADSKRWHTDILKDIERDMELKSYGWTLYHVSGAETFKSMVEMSEYGEYDPDSMENSSEGLIWALRYIHYTDGDKPRLDEAEAVLRRHRI